MSVTVSRPSRVTGLGLVALAPASWWLGGLPGALLGGGLALTGLVLSPPTLFAVAHIVWLLFPRPTVVDMFVFEAVLAAVLFGDPVYRTVHMPVPAIAVVVFIPAAWLASTLTARYSPLAASVGLLGCLALVGYGIHRYELVQLDLIDASTDLDAPADPPTDHGAE